MERGPEWLPGLVLGLIICLQLSLANVLPSQSEAAGMSPAAQNSPASSDFRTPITATPVLAQPAFPAPSTSVGREDVLSDASQEPTLSTAEGPTSVAAPSIELSVRPTATSTPSSTDADVHSSRSSSPPPSMPVPTSTALRSAEPTEYFTSASSAEVIMQPLTTVATGLLISNSPSVTSPAPLPSGNSPYPTQSLSTASSSHTSAPPATQSSSLQSVQPSLEDFNSSDILDPPTVVTTVGAVTSTAAVESVPISSTSADVTARPTTSAGTPPTVGSSSTNGTDDTLIIIVAAAAGGGVLLIAAATLCLVLLCCCCCCCVARRRKRRLTHSLGAAGSTASLRRQNTLDRKGSIFMDDPNYVVKLDRSQGSLRSVKDDDASSYTYHPYSQDTLHEGTGVPLDDTDAPAASRLHSQPVELSSPQASDTESDMETGPKYVHSLPSPMHGKVFHSSYASLGPSSTPQLHSKYLSTDLILPVFTGHHQTSDKHLEQQQRESPLLTHYKAGRESAEPRSNSPSIYLGGDNLDFDKEGFKQYLDVALSVGPNETPPVNSRRASLPGGQEQPIMSLRDRHMSSVSNQLPNHAYHQASYPSPQGHEDSASPGRESMQTSRRSIPSSTLAVQGEPSLMADVRSYTPSMVGSSVDGGGSNVARQSWIEEDGAAADLEDQPGDPAPPPSRLLYSTSGSEDHRQAPHPAEFTRAPSAPSYPPYLRRIRSDNQMRYPPYRDIYPAGHARPHGSQTLKPSYPELIKKKRDRRGTCKEVTGFKSVDEFFEHVWTSKDNLRAHEVGGKETLNMKSLSDSRQRATTLN